MNYYSPLNVASCAQHVEAKTLANKLWNQWHNIVDKASDEALKPLEEIKLERIEHLCTKADKIHQEFNNIRRGLRKCCGH